MPQKRARERAQRDREQGKAPTTQAGEFVREEMESLKQGKPQVKSRKQAVAIGLSEARRAGVEVPPQRGRVKVKAESRAQSAYRASGKSSRKQAPSKPRSGSRTKKKR